MHDLLVWTLVSIPVIILVGTALHFVFDWSGRRRIVAVFAPVNESLWEHVKMAYWPLVLYTAVEFAVFDPPTTRLASAALGFYAMTALILGLYYPTAAVWPGPESKGRLLADGTIFVIAVAAGQMLNYLLVEQIQVGAVVGLLMLLAPAAVLAVATFTPPRQSMFQDQINGTYGVRAAR